MLVVITPEYGIKSTWLFLLMQRKCHALGYCCQRSKTEYISIYASLPTSWTSSLQTMISKESYWLCSSIFRKLIFGQWVSRPAGRTSHYGNKDEFPKSGGSICPIRFCRRRNCTKRKSLHASQPQCFCTPEFDVHRNGFLCRLFLLAAAGPWRLDWVRKEWSSRYQLKELARIITFFFRGVLNGIKIEVYSQHHSVFGSPGCGHMHSKKRFSLRFSEGFFFSYTPQLSARYSSINQFCFND